MTWQAYVDLSLMGCEVEGNRLSAAGILSKDGTSVWASSSTFSMHPEEVVEIKKEFDEAGYLAPTGLYLSGEKYTVVQGEAGAVIRAKKGPEGVTIKKTTQALIFGIYDEPMTASQCNFFTAEALFFHVL